MSIKNIIKETWKYFYILREKRILRNIDKERCRKHTDWERLTKNELKKIDIKDEYAYIAYKNIFGEFSEKFVSDALCRTEILPRLTPIYYVNGYLMHSKNIFEDKNYQDFFMRELTFPEIVVRNIGGVFFDDKYNEIKKENVIRILERNESLFFKRSLDEGHGSGVKFVGRSEYERVLSEFGKDYIVEKIIKQCELFNYYNASSVNVIRITSLFLNGEVYILGGILRIGAPGAYCDHLPFGNVNPRIIPISEDGKLISKSIDPNDGFVFSDVFGKEIVGEIPNYNVLKDNICKIHKKYNKYGLIGWDFTIDDKGEFICIEYNSDVPGIVQSQFALGPIFAKRINKYETFLDAIMKLDKN